MTKPNDNSQAAKPLGLPLNDGLGACTYKCEAWPECGCAPERAALDLKDADIERLRRVLEDARTQRDELLAHLTRGDPLPAWAVEWIRVYKA